MVLFGEIYSFALQKARKQSWKKFDDGIENDVFSSKLFGLRFNAKKHGTNRIMQAIEEYKRKKQEEERIKKEKEEKEEKQRKLKELQALKEKEAMEMSVDEDDAAVTKLRDAKLCELDDDDDELIQKIFELESNKTVGSHEKSNIEVRVKDLNTLETGQWLNDEVMNFYMALLQDRNIKRCQDETKHCKVLFLNTFFYTKLSSNGYNYKAVKRWTKKVKLNKKGLSITSIFELDKVIFPVHVNKIHWCCGCINLRDKRFEYYDSMNGASSSFFGKMRRYIADEFQDKLKGDQKKFNLDLDEWTNENNKSTYPQQENGVDCGVFTSKCADWISDDLYPDYSQQDMEYFRTRMMVEIIRGKTLDF